LSHIEAMEQASKKPTKTSHAKRYRIAGITHDGVAILKSPGRATHFTDKEIRDTIAIVLREAATGKFVSSRSDGRKL
jgi:hypothetical protein